MRYLHESASNPCYGHCEAVVLAGERQRASIQRGVKQRLWKQ